MLAHLATEPSLQVHTPRGGLIVVVDCGSGLVEGTGGGDVAGIQVVDERLSAQIVVLCFRPGRFFILRLEFLLQGCLDLQGLLMDPLPLLVVVELDLEQRDWLCRGGVLGDAPVVRRILHRLFQGTPHEDGQCFFTCRTKSV